MPLRLVLSTLGIKARQLHNSGNDAVHMLKVMLHLFCSYQADAIDKSKLCVKTSYRERDEVLDLLWRERLDLLRAIARTCPRPMSLREARRPGRPPKTPRVDDPNVFESDAPSPEGVEGILITIFGDEL